MRYQPVLSKPKVVTVSGKNAIYLPHQSNSHVDIMTALINSIDNALTSFVWRERPIYTYRWHRAPGPPHKVINKVINLRTYYNSRQNHYDKLIHHQQMVKSTKHITGQLLHLTDIINSFTNMCICIHKCLKSKHIISSVMSTQCQKNI